MAFKSRAGKISGVCRNCSELKDNMGTCSCNAEENTFKCKSCRDYIPNSERSEHPGWCQNCVDYYANDDDDDDSGDDLFREDN